MQASVIAYCEMNEYSFRLWHDSAMAATAKKPRRTASREQRRQQLIDATIKCIARKGMGSTTLGDVAGEAGLSQGIVNLHFESKDNLLNETLRFIADEYRTQFDRALEKSGPSAAAKLYAVLELDLRPSILDRRKLAVWFAFWGEVKSRPTYRRTCEKSDEYYDEVVRELCDELITDGRYKSVSAAAITTALTSMTNGMWLSCLISPRLFDRQDAMNAIDEYLISIFPQHFPL
jgi:TetR/AcrR family transcriptional repressor of bet genes